MNCSLINNDGYVNLTILCKNAGKDIREWKKNKSSKNFLTDLSVELNMLTSEILKIIRIKKTQYTFAHPLCATYIAHNGFLQFLLLKYQNGSMIGKN